MRTFGWLLQLLALVVVGTALLIGLFHNALRAEIGLLVAGSLMFLGGRRLNRQ